MMNLSAALTSYRHRLYNTVRSKVLGRYWTKGYRFASSLASMMRYADVGAY